MLPNCGRTAFSNRRLILSSKITYPQAREQISSCRNSDALKDNHREKAPSNKIPAYKKYEYGNFGPWHIKSNLKLKQDFQKNEAIPGKAPFFVIDPFCTQHSICLNIGFSYGIFTWNVCIFNLSVSMTKRYSSFSEKLFLFQKTCFRLEVLKMFKMSTDCHIKICGALEWRTILKISCTAF